MCTHNLYLFPNYLKYLYSIQNDKSFDRSITKMTVSTTFPNNVYTHQSLFFFAVWSICMHMCVYTYSRGCATKSRARDCSATAKKLYLKPSQDRRQISIWNIIMGEKKSDCTANYCLCEKKIENTIVCAKNKFQDTNKKSFETLWKLNGNFHFFIFWILAKISIYPPDLAIKNEMGPPPSLITHTKLCFSFVFDYWYSVFPRRWHSESKPEWK